MTIVYVLSLYYSRNNVQLILNYATPQNVEALKLYLNLFNDVYDYCSKIYFICDKNFIDKMITQGSKAIDSGVRAMEYIEIAKDYWAIKKEYLINHGIKITSAIMD